MCLPRWSSSCCVVSRRTASGAFPTLCSYPRPWPPSTQQTAARLASPASAHRSRCMTREHTSHRNRPRVPGVGWGYYLASPCWAAAPRCSARAFVRAAFIYLRKPSFVRSRPASPLGGLRCPLARQRRASSSNGPLTATRLLHSRRSAGTRPLCVCCRHKLDTASAPDCNVSPLLSQVIPSLCITRGLSTASPSQAHRRMRTPNCRSARAAHGARRNVHPAHTLGDSSPPDALPKRAPIASEWRRAQHLHANRPSPTKG